MPDNLTMEDANMRQAKAEKSADDKVNALLERCGYREAIRDVLAIVEDVAIPGTVRIQPDTPSMDAMTATIPVCVRDTLKSRVEELLPK